MAFRIFIVSSLMKQSKPPAHPPRRDVLFAALKKRVAITATAFTRRFCRGAVQHGSIWKQMAVAMGGNPPIAMRPGSAIGDQHALVEAVFLHL
ncbi:hypothetical protein ACE04B_42515, partial [Rhizobium phaseoli]